ncbi:MAG: DUF1566 domain-containing protein [Desulfosalsimonadaceae bacterium]
MKKIGISIFLFFSVLVFQKDAFSACGNKSIWNSLNVFSCQFNNGFNVPAGGEYWIRMGIGFEGANGEAEAIADKPNIALAVTMNGEALPMDGDTVIQYNDAAGFWEINSYHCTGTLTQGTYNITGTSYKNGNYVDSANFVLTVNPADVVPKVIHATLGSAVNGNHYVVFFPSDHSGNGIWINPGGNSGDQYTNPTGVAGTPIPPDFPGYSGGPAEMLALGSGGYGIVMASLCADIPAFFTEIQNSDSNLPANGNVNMFAPYNAEGKGPFNKNNIDLTRAVPVGTAVTVVVDMNYTIPHFVAVMGGAFPNINYDGSGSGTLTIASTTCSIDTYAGDHFGSSFGFGIFTDPSLGSTPLHVIGQSAHWVGDVLVRLPEVGDLGTAAAKIGADFYSPAGSNRIIRYFMPNDSLPLVFGGSATPSDLRAEVNGVKFNGPTFTDMNNFGNSGKFMEGEFYFDNVPESVSLGVDNSQPTGYITVTLVPQSAIAAGAQWRISCGDWKNSGTTVGDLVAGQYTVEFKAVTGWTDPAVQTVTITGGQITNVNGGYIEITPSHSTTPGGVPDTGQDKCYNETGEIPCPQPGEPFYGQDAQYVGPRSYTKLDALGNDLPDSAASWTMVRDNVTGLIWEVKENADGNADYDNPHDADNTYTWYDPDPATNGGNAGTPGNGTDIKDFIDDLNTEYYGGHNDWRMPTIHELPSIVNFGRVNIAIDINFFSNTQSDRYWSVTTFADNTGDYDAWAVNFNGGNSSYQNNKGLGLYARAVRSGRAGTLDMVINGDGTITDPNTGLMWRQTTDGTMNWQDALDFCEDLDFVGYDDWRLPDENELRAIVNFGRYYPSIDLEFFPDTFPFFYWSSTTYTYSNTEYYAWSVYFHYGDDFLSDKGRDDGCYVRAVRGGQFVSLLSWAILCPTQASRWTTGQTMPINWVASAFTGDVIISISRDGGKTFTDIASTSNDGAFNWTVSGVGTVNCMLKIVQATDPTKTALRGLFSIQTGTNSNVILSEDFEAGILDPRISITSGGGFNANPGIKEKTEFGSTKAFGYGMSDCGANCFNDHVTDFRIAFPAPTYISHLSFKEMELFGNWGSGGKIYIDGEAFTPPNDPLVPESQDFGRKPCNDWQADTDWRIVDIAVNKPSTEILLKVVDITNSSEIFIDDLIITEESQADGFIGDINNDKSLNLSDIILALKIAAGIDPGVPILLASGVNRDGKIGMPEAVYVLQVTAGLRPEAVAGDVTGRWEATIPSSDPAGVFGFLLTQSGTDVTGTIAQWPIANGKFINGILTGSFYGDGRDFDFQLTLSGDNTTLDGTVTRHYNDSDTTFHITFTRLSVIPQNPDPTPPAVNATSPYQNQTNVARSNLVIAVTWSKPVNGWDAKLTGKIGGIQSTIKSNNLIDDSKNTYDADTHTFTLYLQSGIVLDPLTTYTLALDTGTTDWHDPYGVSAWPDASSAYQITFTTGN